MNGKHQDTVDKLDKEKLANRPDSLTATNASPDIFADIIPALQGDQRKTSKKIPRQVVGVEVKRTKKNTPSTLVVDLDLPLLDLEADSVFEESESGEETNLSATKYSASTSSNFTNQQTSNGKNLDSKVKSSDKISNKNSVKSLYKSSDKNSNKDSVSGTVQIQEVSRATNSTKASSTKQKLDLASDFSGTSESFGKYNPEVEISPMHGLDAQRVKEKIHSNSHKSQASGSIFAGKFISESTNGESFEDKVQISESVSIANPEGLFGKGKKSGRGISSLTDNLQVSKNEQSSPNQSQQKDGTSSINKGENYTLSADALANSHNSTINLDSVKRGKAEKNSSKSTNKKIGAGDFKLADLVLENFETTEDQELLFKLTDEDGEIIEITPATVSKLGAENKRKAKSSTTSAPSPIGTTTTNNKSKTSKKSSLELESKDKNLAKGTLHSEGEEDEVNGKS